MLSLFCYGLPSPHLDRLVAGDTALDVTATPLNVSIHRVNIKNGWNASIKADRSFLQGDDDGITIRFDDNFTVVSSADEFVRNVLPQAQPNWLIFVGVIDLLNMSGSDYCSHQTASVSTSAFAQAVLKHQKALQIVLDDACCQVNDWPLDSHHTLYRRAFSRELHQQLTREGSLRDMPYGIFPGSDMGPGSFSTRPSDQRKIFMSFTGSNSGLYTKGARCATVEAITAARDDLDSIAAAAMADRPLLDPPPPGGSHRIYVHMDMITNRKAMNCSHLSAHWPKANISYPTLLSESVFGLAPPGDFWESYRLWELIESGTIPIVLRTKGLYSNCNDAAYHLLHTIDGVLYVDDYAELPSLFRRVTANGWAAVVELQRRLLTSYFAKRRQVRKGIAQVAAYGRRLPL